MSDACTIYVNRVDYNKVQEIIEAVSTNPVEVIGDADKWEQITVRGQSTLTFAAMERRPHEHDDFSNLILGTYAYFQNTKTDFEAVKDRMLTSITECQFALGVVGRPAFDEAEKHYDIVFAVTEAFGGLIFSSTVMLDQNGLLVLDKDGNSDLTDTTPTEHAEA